MTASLAGARVALWGEFSSAEAERRCRAYVVASGGTSCDLGSADVTHVIRGEITRTLSERLGASPRERDWVRRGVIVLDEAAIPFVLNEPQREPNAVVSKDEPEETDATRPADPGIAVLARRHAHVTALVARGSSGALATLADTLRDDGVDRSLEARGFAQLVARGVTRYSRAAPFAAEFPLLRTRGSDPHVERSRTLGSVDSFSDDDGRRWCRVRFASPSTYDRATVERMVDFIERIARRRRARVWLAGFALPAALGRTTWTALLATLAQR